jgi:translation initiation factor 3 subunit L
VYEILSMYESSFAKITDKYFKASSWPPVEAIAPYVDYDHVFCMLYKEMYYRHIFARLTPTLEQRCASWENYCELFGVILQGNVNMQLPNLWLWEMVDEFIYQFQSFSQYRGKLALKSPEEVEALRAQPAVWNVLGVVNYLQALADTSGVVRILEAERGGEVGFSAKEGYDYHSSNVLRVLGYFSLVGLARVHCLLGDYAGGLRALDPIDLDKPGLFTKVSGAHVTTLYYVGFAYLMARRYTDAIRSFNAALVYIARHKAFHSRAAGYEQIVKKAEQMYALLAVAVALCPQHKLLEDGVKSALADKYAEKMVKMAGGDEGVYDELFSFACPKFVTASPPDYEDPSAAHSTEAYRLQLRMFLAEVRAASLLPLVRSFLKLYTTIPVAQLAALMDYEEGALRQVLLALKRKATVKEWRGGASALDGVWTSTGDVDFYIDGDMVHVVDSKPQRQYVYELVTAIDKQRELQQLLKQK